MGITRREVLRGAGAAAGATAVAVSGASSALGLPATGAAGAGEPFRLARVWVSRAQQHLVAAFDETHTVWADGSMELLLWPGDLPALQATGLRYEITVPDLEARDAAERAAAAAAPVARA